MFLFDPSDLMIFVDFSQQQPVCHQWGLFRTPCLENTSKPGDHFISQKEVCRAKPGDHLEITNLGITSNLGINFEAGDHLTWGSIGVQGKTWGSLSKPGDHLHSGSKAELPICLQ